MERMTMWIFICLISGVLLLLIVGVLFRLIRAVRGTRLPARLVDKRMESPEDGEEAYVLEFQTQEGSRHLRCPSRLYSRLQVGDEGMVTCRGVHLTKFRK